VVRLAWAIFRKIPLACLFEFSTWLAPALGLPAGTVCHLVRVLKKSKNGHVRFCYLQSIVVLAADMT
jgi:hypothetical protein